MSISFKRNENRTVGVGVVLWEVAVEVAMEHGELDRFSGECGRVWESVGESVMDEKNITKE